MTTLQRARSRIKSWRESPVKFVHDNFQVTPDAWQVKALEAFGRQDVPKLRLALRACVGPGKSAVLAWCGWNFLSCYGRPGHHPKAAAVSITADNLKDNLWPELSKWMSRSPFLMQAFEWSKERIYAKDHPETWFLSARSFSKTADAEAQGRTLSGLHSEYVLALIDESGEIPLAVSKAAEQALSERDCKFGRIMQAGNPSSLDGMLYAAATVLAHLWMNLRVTGDPDDPERSPRIDIEWARAQIATYGRANPWIRYSILGEFPESSLNSLLGVDEVEKAMHRHLTEDQYNNAQKRLGIDCARFGDDRTPLFPRQGLASFKPEIMRGARTNEIAARALKARENWQHELDFVDDTGGWGAGVIDSLIQAGSAPIPVNSSGKAMDPRFYNKRAENWWAMASWVKRGGALPPEPDLIGELTAPTYTLKNGLFLMEPKEFVKKRLGRSPDLADALSLTFALPEMPASMQSLLPPGIIPDYNKMKSEWNPHDESRM